MKKFFSKIKNWFKRHGPSKRRLIQVYAALLYNANIKGFIKGSIYTGPVKNVCVPGLNCYSCPGAAAACPLGALQNALAASGTRAPFYVIGIILLIGLILGRTVCGFLCPVGLGQELLYKIKSPKLKKSRYTRILSYFKYVILLVLVVAIPFAFGLNGKAVPAFCKYICPAGTFGGAIGLLIHPNNASLFDQLGSLFTWKFGLMIAIMVASIFIFRFFCRFFCPLGALYGFFNRFALLGVKLDKNKCTDCGLCVNACKMDIKRVGDHECINCGECIDVCPTKAIRWKGSKLFVHQNAVDAVPAPTEEKPLGALLNKNGVSEPEAVEQNSVISEGVVNTQGARAEAVALQEQAEGTVSVSNPSGRDARAKEKRRNFWLQIAAWAAALALLVGALVYYNLIDQPPSGAETGKPCPDFTADLYGEDGGKFTFSEHEGKVVVIYFWSMQSEASITEIPYLEQLKVAYSDVEIVAIHEGATEGVEAYLGQNGWDNYQISLAQDLMTGDVGEIYSKIAVGNQVPTTVVVNREGKIKYNSPEELTYQLLTSLIAGKNIGDYCPDFTVELYGADGGSFTLSEQKGKVTVINFWATWCGPCVAELPYFEQLKVNYPEIEVIAIHESVSEDVNAYLVKHGWDQWNVKFAQDVMKGANGEVYTSLVNGDAVPVTVIVDQQGKIVYNSVKSMEYDSLAEIVAPLLSENVSNSFEK